MLKKVVDSSESSATVDDMGNAFNTTESWTYHDGTAHTGHLVDVNRAANRALYYFPTGMVGNAGRSRSYYQVYENGVQDVNGFFKSKMDAIFHLRRP